MVHCNVSSCTAHVPGREEDCYNAVMFVDSRKLFNPKIFESFEEFLEIFFDRICSFSFT